MGGGKIRTVSMQDKTGTDLGTTVKSWNMPTKG